MKRLGLVLILLAALSVSAAAEQAPGRARGGLQTAASPALDSAGEELRAGRAWHASRILRRLGADTASDPALRLLLARAEAGWENWEEAAKLLGGFRPAGLEPDDLLILARALQETGRPGEAVDAYRAYLRAAPPADDRRAVALAHLARAAFAAGRTHDALATLGSMTAPGAALLASWTAVEGAERLAPSGDTATVVTLLGVIRDGGAREASWRTLPRARLAAGDSLGAERAFRAAREGAPEPRRGEAALEAGKLALARGDSATARILLEEGVELGRGGVSAQAAALLLSFPDTELGLTLRVAAALDAAGARGPALLAYDRAARRARETGSALPDSARLARARLLSAVAAREQEAIEEFRAIRTSTRDPGVGALNLELWARLRERQGRTGDVETLRRWLLEEYPGSPQAAEVLWGRGQAAERAGQLDAALRHYAALARNAPEHPRAGPARMRTAQILLGRGERVKAAEVWEAYLAEFPAGRRWQEATYWAARVRKELGQEDAARLLLGRLHREDPVSYYAVVGAELLGEPYALAVPERNAPVSFPWLEEGVARFQLLHRAGLTAGAEAEVLQLAQRARTSPEALLALAEALVLEGRTLEGINLGWELRDRGAAWDRRLLRVVFPFPYRALIAREAAEWDLDPLLVASLVRQESAFERGIRSAAGAVGLMQVMPATGAEVAGRLGLAGFREKYLEVPEVNLHLGAAYYRDMSRRYGGDITLALCAYNAGPARADRWRRFPEAGDPVRFTEQIPLEETQGYVKNVRRNLAVYTALYGPA